MGERSDHCESCFSSSSYSSPNFSELFHQKSLLQVIPPAIDDDKPNLNYKER